MSTSLLSVPLLSVPGKVQTCNKRTHFLSGFSVDNVSDGCLFQGLQAVFQEVWFRVIRLSERQ